MPLNDWQMIEGAKRRAHNLRLALKADNTRAEIYVGLEGGFHSIACGGGAWLTFLRGWAYVTDGRREGLGATPSILVPAEIADRVIRGRRELSDVIDEAANEFDLRSRQGAWGVLTRELVTRPQTFEVALIAAFAPFYNEGFYKS